MLAFLHNLIRFQTIRLYQGLQKWWNVPIRPVEYDLSEHIQGKSIMILIVDSRQPPVRIADCTANSNDRPRRQPPVRVANCTEAERAEIMAQPLDERKRRLLDYMPEWY